MAGHARREVFITLLGDSRPTHFESESIAAIALGASKNSLSKYGLEAGRPEGYAQMWYDHRCASGYREARPVSTRSPRHTRHAGTVIVAGRSVSFHNFDDLSEKMQKILKDKHITGSMLRGAKYKGRLQAYIDDLQGIVHSVPFGAAQPATPAPLVPEPRSEPTLTWNDGEPTPAPSIEQVVNAPSLMDDFNERRAATAVWELYLSRTLTYERTLILLDDCKGIK